MKTKRPAHRRGQAARLLWKTMQHALGADVFVNIRPVHALPRVQSPLTPQYDIDARENRFQLGTRQLAHPIGKQCAIDRNKLRGVRD